MIHEMEQAARAICDAAERIETLGGTCTMASRRLKRIAMDLGFSACQAVPPSRRLLCH